LVRDSEPEVEKLSEDDATHVERLFKEVWPEAREYPKKWREMRVIDREQIINEMNNGFHYFGIRVNGRIVGLYKALRVGDTLIGENQAVHPAHRRRGLAKAMYKHFIQFAKEVGCRRIRVNILPSQVASEKLVKQFGFKKIMEYEQIPEMLVHLYEKEIES
jgi:GNAT superfamily N-acetyltransferase